MTNEKSIPSYKGFKIHDDIYVDTSLYIGHGQDDFVGGKCQIIEIIEDQDLPIDHFNRVFVRISENPNTYYNMSGLIEKQEQLKEKFGEKRGYPDPDYGDECDVW